MKKLLLYALVLILGFICGRFSSNPEYEFSRNPPQFNEREGEIIKKVYGKIVDSLKYPSAYYISEIKEDDSNIVVYLSALQTLQSGEDKKTGMISAMMDGGKTFVFDKKYNFLLDTKWKEAQSRTKDQIWV